MASPQKTVVVGAGPVGSLAALYAAVRGDEVEIYDLRGDLRDPSVTPLNFTKSINLALSERGINAMRNANRPALLDAVLGDTIPMHGRMIHGRRLGELFEMSQLYDVHGRYIRAVDRAGLNKRLLDELESMPNVKLFFHHKLTGADFKKNTAWFERPNPNNDRAAEIEVNFDFMIGADGAHSAVRYHLMKFTRMSYQQEYVDTLWCEFTIPPGVGEKYNGFRLHPNRLHIWPAGEFMFIAIPSLDKSFTCTLFLDAEGFAKLEQNSETLVGFFDEYFPGVVPNHITEEDLRKQFATNPHLPLISIKCTPYHFSSSVVIVGDAAHAMVPFYGQGMNAGLEDVRVLFEHLDKHTVTTESPEAAREARACALNDYTLQRTPDSFAINDLALRNYGEMRSDVRSPVYLLRKWLEEKLDEYAPTVGWATQYSRISFGNERYSEVEKLAKRQGLILSNIIAYSFVTGLGWVGWLAWKWQKGHGFPRPIFDGVSSALSRVKRLFV